MQTSLRGAFVQLHVQGLCQYINPNVLCATRICICYVATYLYMMQSGDPSYRSSKKNGPSSFHI